MKKRLFFILLSIGLPTQAFGAIDDNTCLGYTLDCDQAKSTLEITRKPQACLFMKALTETTPLDLKKEGIYLPTNDTYSGSRSHSCTLNGHDVKVEMSYIKTPTDSDFNYVCFRSYAYIMVTNIWVEGKKVVDDLYFNGVCNKQKELPGAIVYALSMQLYNKKKERASNTPDLSFKTKVFKDLEDKYEIFYLNTDASYIGGNIFKGQEALPAPLKNIHVHDHDMQYEFWDPHEERESLRKWISEQ